MVQKIKKALAKKVSARGRLAAEGNCAAVCCTNYIAGFPKNVQKVLEKLRETVRKAAPQAEETIDYGIPTFKLNGRNLVHFAAFKNHIGFYPTPSAITAFKKELSPYKQAKGSVQFPLDKPIPLGLIRKMVGFRVKEIIMQEKNLKK